KQKSTGRKYLRLDISFAAPYNKINYYNGRRKRIVKKKFPRLPDSELEVMMALWNGHPDMTRLEVETYLNRKKHLALTTVLSMLTRLEKKKFVSVKKDG